jgi:hypothetical protein
MFFPLLIVLQSPELAVPPAQNEEAAIRRSSEELAACFPVAWRLPRVDRAGRDLPNTRFEKGLSQWLRQPLREADVATGASRLTLGDLLARAARTSQASTPAVGRQELERLLAEAEMLVAPDIWPQVRALLDRSDALLPKWDPEDGDARDGFLMGPSWELPADCWPEHDGGRTVEQGAVFVAADLASIKRCESDFSLYLFYPGNSYLSVAPVAGSYLYCAPAEGLSSSSGMLCAAATALTVDFKGDLPFPFSTYQLRLHYYSDLDEEQRPRTWVYSSSEAFHWLAGCDLFEPVYDGGGAFVGTLIVRQCGADLDGVPDKSSHRQGGMRVALGGLRRDAERLYRFRTDALIFPPRGALPVCPVLAPGS